MVKQDVDRRVLFAQLTTDGDLSGQLYCSRYFRNGVFGLNLDDQVVTVLRAGECMWLHGFDGLQLRSCGGT